MGQRTAGSCVEQPLNLISVSKSDLHCATVQLFGGLLLAMIAFTSAPASAQEGHPHQHAISAGPAAGPLIASTAKPFAELMNDAMGAMDNGMRTAPMNGMPEHDFVTMMMPHHQGAIDMARALLLTTKDPELRNLAQGIVTEQQNEIRLMQAWLKRHAELKQ